MKNKHVFRILKIIIKMFTYFLLISCCIFLFLMFRSTQKNEDIKDKNFLSRLEGPLMGDDPLLVVYLKSKFLSSPSSLPYKFDRITNLQDESYVVNLKLHDFIFQTFNDKGAGFFIEAGALNGEIASNTLWLELNKNWTGLLIEPNYDNCQSLASKNRKAWTSCSCITPRKYPSKTIMEIPHVNDNHNYLTKWLYRANVRSIESRFHSYDDIIQDTASFTYAPVQCFPIITYLLALNVTVIDFLSLDTQGGEKTVLINFPYDKIKVRYMMVEYLKKGPNPSTLDLELVEFLKGKNYKLIKFLNTTNDYIFSLKE